MTVIVVDKPVLKYRVTCTDASCKALLECEETDFKNKKRFSMGRECGSYYGITCPECFQVITKNEMTLINTPLKEDL
jgi:hypothetical protein